MIAVSENRKRAKDQEAQGKEVLSKFRKQSTQDLALLKSNRRSIFDKYQSEIDALSEHQEASQVRHHEDMERFKKGYDQLVEAMEKVNLFV